MFSVYESFIVFWKNKFRDHFYSIYNVDTESKFKNCNLEATFLFFF